MASTYQSNRRNVERKISEQIDRALEAIGLYVEGEAKLNAPVDTGNLRGSIDHKVNDDHVIVGTNVEYAVYVEKGTSKKKAQPYLTPAAEENIENIKRLAQRYLNEVSDD